MSENNQTKNINYVIKNYRSDSGEIQSSRIVSVNRKWLETFYNENYKDKYETFDIFCSACYCNWDIYNAIKEQKAILREFYE